MIGRSNTADLGPLVSCIMPTFNRRKFVPRAIKYFFRQDYPNRELLVIDDGTDDIGDLIPTDSRIRYTRLVVRQTLGYYRNLACEQARGEIIVHWDDDDWMADRRISYQVATLIECDADICGLDRVFYFDPIHRQGWQYAYLGGKTPWVLGATLCYTKSFWMTNPFPHIRIGEDNLFLWSQNKKRVVVLDDNTFFIGIIHPCNTSPKKTQYASWHPHPIGELENLLGVDWAVYNHFTDVSNAPISPCHS